MSSHDLRLAAFREELARRQLDGFVVPLTDEHLSEYIGSYAQRLAWLTGFEGSAGTAVVLAQQAAIFVDGRYTLQVREQVSPAQWSYESIPHTTVAGWLGEHAPPGSLVGYDPWLHTIGWVDGATKALAARGAQLVAVPTNPIDAVWKDRPAPSNAPLTIHPDEVAGKSSAAKRQEVAEWLGKNGCDAVILCALDSIAWAFNVRGKDVSRTPVALAFALIRADASAALFVDPEKVSEAVARHLGSAVDVQPRSAFAAALDKLAGMRVAVDPERTVAAIFDRLRQAEIVEARDPVVLPKAIKNSKEIAGTKAAHVRDGAAVTRFLHWVSTVAAEGNQDELSAAAKLLRFREETGVLQDLSFDTISGAGLNGAVVHYRASEKTVRPIERDSLYLIDSGGQYVDGTTDITRTVAIGTPTAEMRDRFTRVLKGHIALACAVFPTGTRGAQLDTLARQHLWAAGLDYAHGTGHGVGSYLSVHEGPQRIALVGSDEPLQAGMILSNEPGYYKAGAYGIRIENLVLVEPRQVAGAEKALFGFHTLTLAPIDRALIDAQMLTPAERAWLDAYHARVYAEIGPLVPADVRTWLAEVTRPIV